jgi:hypothetical protein
MTERVGSSNARPPLVGEGPRREPRGRILSCWFYVPAPEVAEVDVGAPGEARIEGGLVLDRYVEGKPAAVFDDVDDEMKIGMARVELVIGVGGGCGPQRAKLDVREQIGVEHATKLDRDRFAPTVDVASCSARASAWIETRAAGVCA